MKTTDSYSHRTRNDRHRTARNVITAAVVILMGILLISRLSLDVTLNDSFRMTTEVPDETSLATIQLVPSQCESPTRGKQFDTIYHGGKWGAKMKPPQDFYGNAQWPPRMERKKSASGRGSDLGGSTETSLLILKETIAKYHVRSMIDIPCGDVNWIFDSFETDTLPVYVGLDIVHPVIGVNEMRFAHHSNKVFSYWDATECVLPQFQKGGGGGGEQQQPFDLVHVRDVIQHMPQERGIQFFCNIFRSGAKRLLTTTFPQSDNQIPATMEEGGFYHNNLSMEPFGFPTAEYCTPTHPMAEEDETCLYDLTLPWVQTFLAKKC